MNVNPSHWISELPQELQNKICSYLYFSENVTCKIEQVNETIKNYKEIYLTSLFCEYETDLTLVTYFILKYFLHDKISCDKLQLDFTLLSKSHKLQYDELKRIFANIRLVDILRIFKYIEQEGLSSEFYND